MEMLSREQGTKQWSDGSRETRYEAAAILKAKMTVVWTRAGGEKWSHPAEGLKPTGLGWNVP